MKKPRAPQRLRLTKPQVFVHRPKGGEVEAAKGPHLSLFARLDVWGYPLILIGLASWPAPSPYR